MIEVKNLTKKFGDFTAIEDISFAVEDSSIYGLIGYNGAGKTTLLKTAAGIYDTDGGKVLLDGENAYDNAEIRTGLFYIPDDMYFLTNATVEGMGRFYKGMYESFDTELLNKILGVFGLDKKAKLRSFSKGMKRQAEIAFALASRPRFMLLDEVFDGLDPQKREITKNLISSFHLNLHFGCRIHSAIYAIKKRRHISCTADTVAIRFLLMRKEVPQIKTHKIAKRCPIMLLFFSTVLTLSFFVILSGLLYKDYIF